MIVLPAGRVSARIDGADTTYPTALKLDRLTAVVFGGCDRRIGMHDIRLLNLDVEGTSDERRQTRSLDNERNDALKILARNFVTGCHTAFQVLARRPDKTVIVFDALDEADEKEQISSRLLRPLARLAQIFLLVGTRPDSLEPGRRFRALGESTVEINLDDPRYIGSGDVARFVERRLLAAEEPGRQTPYRNSPEVARKVAEAVAERARNVFLVAHTAVHGLLASASIADVTDPGWVERLPTGLDDAFAQFLITLDARRPGNLSSEKTRAALVPLAFAEGEGLPWAHLWAAVGSAISGSDISDADIALVREHAAAFIVEVIEEGRSVYRLYHEGLAEYLRNLVGNVRETQQRIVETLRSRVPDLPVGRGPNWTLPFCSAFSLLTTGEGSRHDWRESSTRTMLQDSRGLTRVLSPSRRNFC